jgi:hypothetical protein
LVDSHILLSLSRVLMASSPATGSLAPFSLTSAEPDAPGETVSEPGIFRQTTRNRADQLVVKRRFVAILSL